jgi:dihydrofolate synthase/folylpolyglutamate synthase
LSATRYEQVLRWLYSLEAAKGMDFKLERVALALRSLGEPQRRFVSVHVAGTNGKGSVASMLEAVLLHAGHRVGLYTSPHLVRFTERVRVAGEEIPADEVVELTGEIQRVATSRGIELTFFEFVTVLAFLHFARREADVAVVEVGLGGRLDATNVLDPGVSVITTIGLDHTEFLGPTLESIACEKGGIIKPGRPVVIGDVPAPAAVVLRRIAEERGAPLFRAGVDFTMGAGAAPTFEGFGWRLPALEVGLRGAHQRRNAALAVAVLALLRPAWSVSEQAIRDGLARVRWPGRLEIVASDPLVVLDGAHNADGMESLCRELPALLAGRSTHALFGVMKDKDWPPMVRRLAPLCRSVVVTEVLPPRGQVGGPLADAFRSWCEARVEVDPVRAWRMLRAEVRGGEAIVVAGSLFLVGAVYPLLCARADARPTSTGAVCP